MVFPSLHCTCIGWTGQGLLKHSDELLHFLWSAGHTCVDTMSAFFFGMMHPLGLEIHLAANKRVVGVTVCTLVTTSWFDITEVGASCENQVKLVPVFRSGVSPGHFVLGFCHEEDVGD